MYYKATKKDANDAVVGEDPGDKMLGSQQAFKTTFSKNSTRDKRVGPGGTGSQVKGAQGTADADLRQKQPLDTFSLKAKKPQNTQTPSLLNLQGIAKMSQFCQKLLIMAENLGKLKLYFVHP